MFAQYRASRLATLRSMKKVVSETMNSRSQVELTIISKAVAMVFIKTWQTVMKNIAKKVNVRVVGSFLM
jgi:hypothetical protein